MSAPDAITVFLCPTEVYDDYVGTAFRFGHVQAGRPDRGSAYLRATPELLALIEAAMILGDRHRASSTYSGDLTAIVRASKDLARSRATNPTDPSCGGPP